MLAGDHPVSADTVKWWAGHQFGIVPRSCVEAIVAAAEHAPNVSGPTAVAVFTALAVGAGRDGATNGGQAEAAALLGTNAASVRRVVATVLEPAGVATRTPSGVVLHTPGDAPEARRTARSSAPSGAPSAPSGAPPARQAARRPYTDADTDFSQTPPNPPGQLSLVADERPPAAERERLTLIGFDAFWRAYPRKESKGAARRAWDKAVRRARAEDVIAGAQRYAADPNREPQYTAHAATWLNADRWTDDPLPARSAPAGRRSGAAGTMDAAARLLASGALDSAPALGVGR